MSNYEEIKKLLSASRKLVSGDQLNEDYNKIMIVKMKIKKMK
jgi:hypothetical protein